MKQEPDELFEVISQCLMNAFDRIAISGWGGLVYLMYVMMVMMMMVSFAALPQRHANMTCILGWTK